MKEDMIRVSIDIEKRSWENLGLGAKGLDRSRSWVVRRIIDDTAMFVLMSAGDTVYVDPDRADQRGIG